MTTQEYLEALLKSQDVSELERSALRELRNRIEKRLSALEGSPRFYYAGSYGKRTMIRQRYDLDIVIYWPHYTTYTIEGIYNAVGDQLRKEFQHVNSKTVCWEIPFEGGLHVDVVPGRALDAVYKEANLYRTDTETRLKTSIKTHIDTVRNSGRTDAIRLMKLWRERQKVQFKKSFLLEILTIDGCSGTSYYDLQNQLVSALRYIRDNIETIQVKDPANSNNSLSDDIPQWAKFGIKTAAQAALDART